MYLISIFIAFLSYHFENENGLKMKAFNLILYIGHTAVSMISTAKFVKVIG